MELLPKKPSRKGSADIFVGDVWIDEVATGEPPSRMRVSFVRFAPGARNAWHAHALGQWVHVTQGVGRMGSRDGPNLEVRAGDTVYTPPGEWHWHGAAPDRFMTHVAIWEKADEGAESEWGAHVTDDEYSAGR